MNYLLIKKLVHTSPNGRDLVAITNSGVLYFVKNFASVIHDNRELDKAIFTLDLDCHEANCLAFDGRRIAVTTVGVNNFTAHHYLT